MVKSTQVVMVKFLTLGAVQLPCAPSFSTCVSADDLGGRSSGQENKGAFSKHALGKLSSGLTRTSTGPTSCRTDKAAFQFSTPKPPDPSVTCVYGVPTH